MGRATVVLETPEDTPNDTAALERALAGDPTISHVAAVHCETTSGILNPLAEVAEIVARHGRRPADRRHERVRRDPAGGRSRSPSTRWSPRPTSAWRACPASAFASCAGQVLEAAGGQCPFPGAGSPRSMGRHGGERPVALYPADPRDPRLRPGAARSMRPRAGWPGAARAIRENCRILVDGMTRLGFRPLLPAELQAPIIITFHQPTDPEVPVPRVLRPPARSGLCDLPGQADRGGLFPHRLHRPPGAPRRCAARSARSNAP